MFLLDLMSFHYSSFVVSDSLLRFSPFKELFVVLQQNISICFLSDYHAIYVAKKGIGVSHPNHSYIFVDFNKDM